MPAPGKFGEVATETLQSLVLLFGVGILGSLRASDVLEHLKDGLAGHPVALEEVSQPALGRGQAHEHVLGGDVAVLHLVGFRLGGVEHLLRLPAQPQLGGSMDGGEVLQALLQFRAHGRPAHTYALQDGPGDAALLIEERDGQVLGLYLRVPSLPGQLLGRCQCLLGLESETIELHLCRRGARRPGSVR